MTRRGHLDGLTPLIPVSVGELMDKIAILEIKAQQIEDPSRQANVRAELEALEAVRSRLGLHSSRLDSLRARLAEINEALWEIEDAIRACERRADFGPAFVELARRVYRVNDERAVLKRAINELSGSTLIEEKSYAAF